jgi:hypothetical protein
MMPLASGRASEKLRLRIFVAALVAAAGQAKGRLWGAGQHWGDFIAQRFLDEVRQVAAFLASQFGGLGEKNVVKLDHCLHIKEAGHADRGNQAA